MEIFERLQRLFKGRQHVERRELESALEDVERDRRRNRVEIRRWERKRKHILERMKRARSQGSSLEIDYMWDELKEHRQSGGDLRREGRIYNLEGVALKRYLWSLDSLERRSDREGARHLLERIQGSGLMERLSLERDAESRYMEEINTILADFGGLEEEEKADPEKALFLAELDSIRLAEEAGEKQEAEEREGELLDNFDRELEEDH